MKSKNKKPSNSYERAKKRVEEIKGFYIHLAIFLVVNFFVIFFNGRILFISISKEALGNPEFLNWIDWNTYGTSILWAIALGFHALSVFTRNPFLGKNWEERQIEKYMNNSKD